MASSNNATLGFLNVLLYQMAVNAPLTFKDITVGNNECGRMPQVSPLPTTCPGCVGFNAAPGWDPVTGLGVPNFAQMAAYIRSGGGVGGAVIGTLLLSDAQHHYAAYPMLMTVMAMLVLLLC